jgi:hypothetical protein
MVLVLVSVGGVVWVDGVGVGVSWCWCQWAVWGGCMVLVLVSVGVVVWVDGVGVGVSGRCGWCWCCWEVMVLGRASGDGRTAMR